MKSTTQGYIDLTIAQICVAVNTVAAKYLLAYMPINVYLFFRFFLTTIVLLLLQRYLKESTVHTHHPKGRLEIRDWAMLASASICAGPLFNILLMTGMKYTTATSAGIVMSTLPAVLAVFSFFLLGERMSARKIASISLAVCGLLVLSLDSSKGASDQATGSLLGDFLIFLAVIPEALYSIFMKLLHRRVTPLGAGMLSNIITSSILFIPFLFAVQYLDVSEVPLIAWLLLPITVLGSTGFYWLWSRGLSTIPTSTAALFGGVMPIATSITAIIFLGEIFTLYDGTGMLIVILSIVIGTGMKFRHMVSLKK